MMIPSNHVSQGLHYPSSCGAGCCDRAIKEAVERETVVFFVALSSKPNFQTVLVRMDGWLVESKDAAKWEGKEEIKLIYPRTTNLVSLTNWEVRAGTLNWRAKWSRTPARKLLCSLLMMTLINYFQNGKTWQRGVRSARPVMSSWRLACPALLGDVVVRNMYIRCWPNCGIIWDWLLDERTHTRMYKHVMRKTWLRKPSLFGWEVCWMNISISRSVDH